MNNIVNTYTEYVLKEFSFYAKKIMGKYYIASLFTELVEEYIKISNLRAGIEGIPSIMRRRYHIDNRAGKGLLRLKIKFSCSMISINIKRMTKANKKIAQLG